MPVQLRSTPLDNATGPCYDEGREHIGTGNGKEPQVTCTHLPLGSIPRFSTHGDID